MSSVAVSEIAPPSPSKRVSFHKPELDVLRFFAFFSVYCHHWVPENFAAAPHLFTRFPWLLGPVTKFWSISATGLPIFFLLSSYLITDILLRERQRTGSIHVGNFWVRRALRIWPLYFCALLIGLGMAIAHHAKDQELFLASCALFIGNWFYLLREIPWGNPFSVLWSISVEEQFYLLVPFALKVVRDTNVWLLGVGVCVVSLVSIFLQGANPYLHANAWYNSLTQAIFLGAGILVAATTRNRKIILHTAVRWAMIVGAIALLYGSEQYVAATFTASPSSSIQLAVSYVISCIACVTILLALLNAQWKFPKVVVQLGKISYGLYVFHTFSMLLVPFVLKKVHLENYVLRGASIVVTIFLASLSYRYLEMPFLRLKERFTFVETSDLGTRPRDSAHSSAELPVVEEPA